MTKETLKIVFMGTPDFAVESLKALVEGGYNVVGVVTMPDKPVGRHQTSLAASAVKQYALEQGLPVLQPERLRDEEFLQALRAWNADLQIVVAFRMLPEVVWDIRHFQPPCSPAAAISWGGSYQLGHHQRRNANRHHHFLLGPRHRHWQNHTPRCHRHLRHGQRRRRP